MSYLTTTEVREIAVAMTEGARSSQSPSLVSNETLLTMIERASRIFDLNCGVRPEYFESAYYPVWKSSHVYVVGEIVTPTTRNLHKYRVTTAGTSGASEPTFPTGSGATVTNGSVVFTENGADVVATARTFYGNGHPILRLDPYVEGSLSTTLVYPDGYTALDFIARDGYLIQTSTDGVAAPYLRYSSGWYGGVPIIATALWGFDGTPEDVKSAVIELVINLWREVDPVSAKLVNIDGGLLREKLPPRVAETCRRYRFKCMEVAFA
jgi:hypothetical protein